MSIHSSTSRRFRILFMVPNLRGGGAERVVVTLLRHLDRTQFEPSLVVVDLAGAAYLDDLPPDVEVIGLGCTRVRQALLRMVRLIRGRQPDLVFSTLGHLNLALAMVRWALPSETRLIGREATILSQMVETMSVAWLWKLMYAYFYRRFDRIVCQSRTMRQDLVEGFCIPPRLMEVIHNPLEVDRVRQLAQAEAPAIEADPAAIRFITAGRLSHEKGFDLLIEALAQCGNPRMHLSILGEGPLRQYLEDLVAARGLAGQVRFLGFQKNPYPHLRAAHAFVSSSRYEGFPNVVLEAMACGTPVISTPIGASEEILRDVAGCELIADVSPEALARALASFRPGSRLPAEVVTPYAIPAILEQYSGLFLGVLREEAR